MSGVQRITISVEDADQRLDRWLKRLFPHLSQIRIEKMCRKGELRIDGARCKPATRVEAGQEVRIPPVPVPEHREEWQAIPHFGSRSSDDPRCGAIHGRSFDRFK